MLYLWVLIRNDQSLSLLLPSPLSPKPQPTSDKSGYAHKFCPQSTPKHYYSAVVRQKLQPYTDAKVSNLGAFLKMTRNRDTSEVSREPSD